MIPYTTLEHNSSMLAFELNKGGVNDQQTDKICSATEGGALHFSSPFQSMESLISNGFLPFWRGL
jgi:hypothetical protein